MARKKIKKDAVQCRTPGCDREATGSIKGKICKPCYAFFHYWKGRSPGDILNRAETIHRWEQRMNTIVPARVSRISKARTRRRRAG